MQCQVSHWVLLSWLWQYVLPSAVWSFQTLILPNPVLQGFIFHPSPCPLWLTILASTPHSLCYFYWKLRSSGHLKVRTSADHRTCLRPTNSTLYSHPWVLSSLASNHLDSVVLKAPYILLSLHFSSWHLLFMLHCNANCLQLFSIAIQRFQKQHKTCVFSFFPL